MINLYEYGFIQELEMKREQKLFILQQEERKKRQRD